MTRIAFRLAFFCIAGSLATGCEVAPEAADEFRNAVPRKETVEMAVPSGGGQAQSVEGQSRSIQGETADFYKITRGVSLIVNGGGALVLGLVKTVVSFPPTTLNPDSAVWGPWTDDLSPNTYKVTVTRVANHQYEYKFEGKAKTADDSAYVTVLSGTHTAAVDGGELPIEGFGSGSFTLDWDAARTLPEHNPKERGSASYTYSRMSASNLTEVSAQFRQVQDEETQKLVDLDYAYTRAPGGGGSMEFVYVVPPGMGKPGSRWAVNSRWQNKGAGRSDVCAAEGIIAVQANECWNENFASTYLRTSWAENASYGNPETDCVFPTAEYSRFCLN